MKANHEFVLLQTLQGRRHFEHLIKELVPKMLNISLDTVFDRTGFLRTALSPEPNNVDHMLYRVFIAIGDLYRYQYLASQRSKDLNMAKSWVIPTLV